MRGLVLVGVIASVVFLAWMFVRSSTPATSRRTMERQLAEANAFINVLQIEAAQHIAIGDTYAAVVADEIRQYQERVEKIR